MREKNRTQKPLFLLIFFLTLLPFNVPPAFASFKTQEVLSKHRVFVGETFEVTISVLWPEDRSEFAIKEITPPEATGVELIHATQSSSSTFLKDKDVPMTAYHYTYKAVEKGTFELSAFVLELEDSEESHLLIKSNPLEIRVVSIWKRYLREGIFVVLVFTLGLIFLGISFWVKNRRSEIRMEREAKNARISSNKFGTQTQKEIQEAKKFLVSGEDSRFFRELKRILVKYCEHKFQITLEEGDEGESLKGSSQAVEWADILKKIDYYTEQVSFAGGTIEEGERDRILRQIERQFRRAK